MILEAEPPPDKSTVTSLVIINPSMIEPMIQALRSDFFEAKIIRLRARLVQIKESPA